MPTQINGMCPLPPCAPRAGGRAPAADRAAPAAPPPRLPPWRSPRRRTWCCACGAPEAPRPAWGKRRGAGRPSQTRAAAGRGWRAGVDGWGQGAGHEGFKCQRVDIVCTCTAGVSSDAAESNVERNRTTASTSNMRTSPRLASRNARDQAVCPASPTAPAAHLSNPQRPHVRQFRRRRRRRRSGRSPAALPRRRPAESSRRLLPSRRLR